MEDKIKSAIRRSIDALDDIDDVFEDLLDDLPDTARDIQTRSRATLKNVKKRLGQSLKDADVLADETQLQAHLALMEARDRIEASKPVMEDLVAKAGDRSKQLIDEAELKTHLARMEAEDYWESTGKDMAKKYAHSGEQMLESAANSIDELQTRLTDWVESLKKSEA